jgi:peptide deformylase
MILKIVQTGEQVLRQRARPLGMDEIKSDSVYQLIELMRETMRDAPGVGLAAPQVGVSLQLAVIEDRAEYSRDLSAEQLTERERSPVPFHVIINPEISIYPNDSVQFFEGCLSVSGFVGLVGRAHAVQVKCLNERGERVVINAQGWYARILQHEIDHLMGTLYIDRMEPRSFMTAANFARFWRDGTIGEIRARLAISDSGE